MSRRDAKVTTIEGARPVIEVLRAARRRVLEVRVPVGGAGSAALAELERALRERGIQPLPARSGEGVVALAEPFPEEPFEELLIGDEVALLVALDRVTDVGNLGSIARSAEAAGASGLLLEERRAPPIGPGALRASAGALEHLRVGRTPNLRRALELARAEGFGVLAAEAGGSPLQDVDSDLLRRDLVWVFGSEERGTRPAVRALADCVVGIPLAGSVASLGVAAAAAHLLLATAEERLKA